MLLISRCTMSVSKRLRIPRLCDNCRRKKVKCDGAESCQNCINYKVSCMYTHVPKRRSPTTAHDSNVSGTPNKKLKTGRKDELEARVSNVESLLAKIWDQVSGKLLLLAQHQLSPLVIPDHHHFTTTTSPPMTPGASVLDKPQETESHADHPLNPDLLEEMTLFEKNNSIVVEFDKSPHYFGAHSSFSIFSPKGIKWISSKSQDPELIRYYRYFIITSQKRTISMYKVWTDSLNASELKALPSQEVLETFLKAIATNLTYYVNDIDHDHIINLHQRYSNKEILRNSEYLLLNVIFCLGVTVIVDLYKLSPQLTQPFSSTQIDTQELCRILKDCYKNCVFYYQRIAVVGGGGIDAIQALLLFLKYGDLSFNNHPHYMVSSTLIRFAQEAGLHRCESYMGMKTEDALKRLSLFVQCYIVDRYASLQSGKPPILHDEDISSVNSKALKNYWFEKHLDQNFWEFNIQDYLESLGQNLKPKTQLELQSRQMLLKSKVDDFLRNPPNTFSCLHYWGFLNLELSEISSKLYKQLFSATLLIGKTPKDVEQIVSSLNMDLRNWKTSCPDFFNQNLTTENLTPNDIFNTGSKGVILSEVLLMQFQYLFITMTINRMTSKTSWVPLDNIKRPNENSNSMDICVESAKRIIELAHSVTTRIPQFAKTISFYPFCSAIVLFCSCLQDPTSPSVKDNVKLMVKVQKTIYTDETVSKKMNYVKQLVEFYILLVIQIYETNFPNDTTFQAEEYQQVLVDIKNDYNMFLKMSLKLKLRKTDGIVTTEIKSEESGTRSASDMLLDQLLMLQQRQQAEQARQNQLIQRQMQGQQVPVSMVPSISPDFNTVSAQDAATRDLYLQNYSDSQGNPSPQSLDFLLGMNDDLPILEAFNNTSSFLYQSLFNMPTFMFEGNNFNPDNRSQMDLFDF